MKRFTAQLFFTLLLVAVVGCGQKPAPIYEAKPIDQPRAEDADLKPPPKPAASDPNARKVLDDMLAAHAGGDPTKMAALRECTFTRRGQQEGPAGRFPATWSRILSWPTGYRLSTDLDLGGGVKQQLVFALGPAGGWRATVGNQEKATLGADDRTDLTVQSYEDALTLLFPFADPDVVVSDAGSNDPGVTELHAWVPTIGYVRLTIDAKTKLLGVLAYSGREAGTPVMKELTFGDYKEIAGVKLGAKLAVRTKTKTLGEWTELTLEVRKPDPKVFEVP